MKKHTLRLLTLVEVVILLGALALFALQNPNTLTLFLNYTTKHLGLTYDSVSGNLLKTVTVKNIRYRNKVLSSEASIDWNIRALFTAALKIDEISVQNLDIPLTQAWISDLSKRFGTSQKAKQPKIPTIEISQLVFSAKPFENDTVKISRIELQANAIKGNLRHIDIDFFSFLIQSNYADITALGTMKQNRLFFEKLWLAEIDPPKMFHLIKQIVAKRKTKASGKKQQIIKSLLVDNLILYTKPLKYRHYNIKSWSLSIRHLYTQDLKTFDATHVYLDATTNIWQLSSSGNIKANRFYSEVDLSLSDRYFKRFVPFFDHNSLNPIKLYLTVDKDMLHAKLHTKSKNLLSKPYHAYQLAIPSLDAHASFNFHTIQMQGEIVASVQSHYTPTGKLRGRIYYDKQSRFHYDGTLQLPSVHHLPKTLLPLLQENNITFSGNTKQITATLKNPHLTAIYTGTNYTKAMLKWQTDLLTPQLLKFSVPKALEDLSMTLKGTMPIDFKHLFPLKPRLILHSNLANIDALTTLHKNGSLQLDANIPKPTQTLLKKLLPNLRYQALLPLSLNLKKQTNQYDITLQSHLLKAYITHHADHNQTNATVMLAGHKITIDGNIAHDFNLSLHTASLRELQLQLQQLYRFQPLSMDGDLHIETKITDLRKIQSRILGQWFIYEYQPYRYLFGEKIALDLNYHYSNQKHHVEVPRYRFHTYWDRNRYFYATKPSSAEFGFKQFNLHRLWINDQGTLHGNYHLDKRQGSFYLQAKNYHYQDIEGNFFFDTALKIDFSPENTDIEGEIFINNGTITYAPKKTYDVQDEDIVIIQEQTKPSQTKDTLTLDINILSKKPIYYNIGHTSLKLSIDLKVWKELHKSLELLGIVKILNGTHTQSGKEFELDPSEILFGGDLLNPYLNIHAIHRSDPYTIYVNINGQLDAPAINFSATPYLHQSDILSILLFNTTTDDLLGSNQDSSKAAISMFGTVFAKEIVKNFGIKLDKLVLTTTQEGKIGVELGKKLSKKITLIYINDIVQTIKVRYKLSDHFESDFVFSPDNSGIDIIYKDEY